MNAIRRVGVVLAVVLGLYVLLPIVVFDFSSTAIPFDEENYNGHQVAIGPRPRGWIPGAAHDFDIPGGIGYAPDGWTFVVWKPVCLAYLRAHGYERPADWR